MPCVSRWLWRSDYTPLINCAKGFIDEDLRKRATADDDGAVLAAGLQPHDVGGRGRVYVACDDVVAGGGVEL